MADIRDINKAIYAINSSAVFHIGAENSADVLDSCTIEWLEGTTPISKADIQTKMDELQAEYDAQEYARKRKSEYPTIEELVVALYDTDDKAAIEAKRAEVKAKYPK